VAGIEIGKLFAGDRRTLARAITLVESSVESDEREARTLLDAALPKSGGSLRIAITGAPGVGKSTLIDAFGAHLIASGRRVAVLAVDPTSPKSGGSILGDKTRMEALAREPAAFIRPSPTGGNPGGIAHRTREALLLCEAAGFDVVIVETVGVGQSEVDVAGMVDMFVVIVLPNAGDELQGIKRGIIEFADLVVVNKADTDSVAADLAMSRYQGALRLFAQSGLWQPRAMTCSARDRINIDVLWDTVEEFFAVSRESGDFERKRVGQNVAWFHGLLQDRLGRRLRASQAVHDLLPELERRVATGAMTALAAVSRIEELA